MCKWASRQFTHTKIRSAQLQRMPRITFTEIFVTEAKHKQNGMNWTKRARDHFQCWNCVAAIAVAIFFFTFLSFIRFILVRFVCCQSTQLLCTSVALHAIVIFPFDRALVLFFFHSVFLFTRFVSCSLCLAFVSYAMAHSHRLYFSVATDDLEEWKKKKNRKRKRKTEKDEKMMKFIGRKLQFLFRSSVQLENVVSFLFCLWFI